MEAAENPPKPPRGSALWTLILSMLTPGLGHLFARVFTTGLVFMVASESLGLAMRGVMAAMAPTPMALGLFLAMLLAAFALFVWAAVDAHRWLRTRQLRPKPTRLRSTWFAMLVLLGLGVAEDWALPFGWQSFVIPSGSMEPGLLIGDYLLADARHPGAMPARGAVVVFTHPKEPGTDYIKRVIGLPGDRVALQDSAVILNGTPLARQALPDGAIGDETFHRWMETMPGGPAYTIQHSAQRSQADTMAEFLVPAGMMFMMGDNRDNSLDSRFPALGPVPVANILGIAGTRYWARDKGRIYTPVE